MRKNGGRFDPGVILFYILGSITGWFLMYAIELLLREAGVL